MTCTDLRRVADSFLARQLTPEANHDILRHLDDCAACRHDVAERRRLRSALRAAVDRAPELQPSADFRARLRDQLRVEADHSRTRAISRRSWLALAAAAVLTVGLPGGIIMRHVTASVDALAQDAIGDHQNCALKYRWARNPVPLPEAAAKFDSAYRVLLSAPPDDIATPGGAVRVLERHVCAYDARRFGHVIMEYRGHVVSLLMTTAGSSLTLPGLTDSRPHPIGRSRDGLSVVSVDGPHHAILLVSDLGKTELAQLSAIIAKPLEQRLSDGTPAATADVVVALQRAQAPDVTNRPIARR
jgi:hypothetical protein